MTEQTHFRTCHLCEAMCGVAIEVEGERILSRGPRPPAPPAAPDRGRLGRSGLGRSAGRGGRAPGRDPEGPRAERGGDLPGQPRGPQPRLGPLLPVPLEKPGQPQPLLRHVRRPAPPDAGLVADVRPPAPAADRKSTRLNSSHVEISYAVFCLKKKKKKKDALPHERKKTKKK